MLIPVIVLLCSGAIVLLYRFFTTRRGARALWRSSVAIGSSVGIMRAVLACVGWYGVEHTGGPLQIPAFALAMLAWPEAIVFGRHRGPVPLSFYPLLALLLVATSMLMVSGVALAVQVTRVERDA
jgi:hypothetical protein